jgi:steroid 5-alpha reductase family enzyme
MKTTMKLKHIINCHKGMTFILILGLMGFYDNYSIAAWVYLALHGTYGLMWLIKDRIYPDKQWEAEVSLPMGVVTFFGLGSYWLAPVILIGQRIEVSPALIAAAISINLLGVLLHYTSDAQKYYTLKYQPGLISEGFFARCRNTNYLGEFLIYFSFALLPHHWLPFTILGGFTIGVFIPNMLKKDKSLSRYPGFAEYQANSGLFIPKLLRFNHSSVKQSS